MIRIVVLLAAGALLFVPAVRSGQTGEEPSSSLAAAVVVGEGEPTMRLALDCLTRIRESPSNDGDTVLVKLLEATGFRLKKVLAKEYKTDPSRVRFGFEFVNRDDVKSVYWESDCQSAAGSAERVASR